MSTTPIKPEYEAILREMKVLCRYRSAVTNRYDMSLLNRLPRFSLFIKMSLKGNKKEAEYWTTIATKGDALQRKKTANPIICNSKFSFR